MLKTYRDIVFAEPKTDTAMGFWLRTDIPEDQLRALFVGNLNYYSFAGGYYGLYNDGSFLRVAPVVTPQARGARKMTKFIPRDKLEHLIWTPQDSLPTPKQEPAPAKSPQPSVALGSAVIF